MAGDVAAQAQDKAKEVGGQAAERVQAQTAQSLGTALGKMRLAVDQQSVVMGERVNTVAQRARLIAAELRGQGENTPAKTAEQAAARGQQLGDWLKQLDADQLVGYAQRVQPSKAAHGLEQAARRRPLLALGTGVALGFLPARLLKASSARRHAAEGAAAGDAPSAEAVITGESASPSSELRYRPERGVVAELAGEPATAPEVSGDPVIRRVSSHGIDPSSGSRQQ